MGPILLSVVERCPLHGGVILFHTAFWETMICSLFGDVHYIEMSVIGGSIVDYSFLVMIRIGRSLLTFGL